MAQTYYDSAFTGAQIDAAVRTSAAIASASVPQNAGKVISVDTDGNLIAVDIAELIPDGDSTQY